MKRIPVKTPRQLCMVEITQEVEQAVRETGVQDGIVFLFSLHTTAGLTIQENADPGVQHDMLLVLQDMAPRQDARYRHMEDNSAAHLQSAAMGCSTFVLLEGGQLVLGRWQGIYLCEFDGPRSREVAVKVLEG